MADWTMPDIRAGEMPPEALVRMRAAVAGRALPILPSQDLDLCETERGGVRCLEIAPPTVAREFLYLHGGGYRLGGCRAWAGLAGQLAIALSARMILPEYRLAPEHPFPAALHDAIAVLRSRSGGDLPLVIGGDSAGGGLAAATMLAARRLGLALPQSLVLLSPWLDLTLTGDSAESRIGRDLFFPLANAKEAAGQYLQGHPADDPLASPVFADLAGFAPSILFSSTEETILSDTPRFAAQLAMANTPVQMQVFAGMQHVWPILEPDHPVTRRTIEAIACFVEQH